MKLKTLFILLVGMISLTTSACTSMLEQKQKPAITFEQDVDAAIVQTAILEVANDFELIVQDYSKTNAFIKTENETKELKPHSDVGWKSKSNDCFKLNFIRNQHRIQPRSKIPLKL